MKYLKISLFLELLFVWSLPHDILVFKKILLYFYEPVYSF